MESCGFGHMLKKETVLYRTYKIQQIILTIYCMLMFPINVFVVEVACYN